LHLERHFRRFVEEQRAASGALEVSGLRANGAGEATALVTEQLRFDQRRRDRSAVDGHERLRPPPAQLMNRLCSELLASAALSGQQHAHARRRHTLDACEQISHGWMRADQRTQPTRAI